MRAKRNKANPLAIALALIVLISVGYAFLSTQLKINGNAGIKGNNWNIYFTNVQIKEGSVTATTAPTTEGTSTTTINWAVSLATPGQFYEYNVDVVNGGTLDAMVATATNEIITSTLSEEQQKYLDYSIKYVNGASVEQYDKLAAGETKTITVRLAFKNDIGAADLPSADQTGISLSYTANYVQADDRAVEKATKVSQSKIGEPIDYVTSLNGVTLNSWDVFYSDENNTYLIYAGVLPTTAVSIPGISTTDGMFYPEDSSTATLINAMTNKSNWNNLLTGTLNGTIEVDERANTNAWAIGTPTIELWKNSWNTKYPGNRIYTATKSMEDGLSGYYIGSEENPDTYADQNGLGYVVLLSGTEGSKDSLYFSEYGTGSNDYMYLIASASAYEGFGVTIPMCGIKAGAECGISICEMAGPIRPIICLPNSVVNQGTVKKYTVTFDKNNEDATGTMENQSFIQNRARKLHANTFAAKAGYHFASWNTEADASGTSYADEQAVTNLGDKTLYAQWAINTYTIAFNANGGTGTMSNQTMTYDTASNLTANNFTRPGYTFTGWNTRSNGSGTSYSNREEVNNLATTNGATFNLYAQWELMPTKYAVQIYGINQDVDANGNTLGLTFGPATGANYNNSYVTHKYEETSEGSGEYYVKIVTHTVPETGSETTSEEYLYKNGGTTEKVTRTQAQVNARANISLHDMTWAEIKAVSDKTVFEDCMLCGDTKSVSLTLNSTLASGKGYNQYGDGAGVPYNTINYYYTKWNPSQSQNSYVGTGVTLDSDEIDSGSNARNAGGYSVSYIRATLIGKNAKTNEGYAGNENLTSDTCLYSCIESDLQAVITPKKIKYVTGTSESSYSLNDDIADSIWLFSDREMYGTGQYSGNTTEGLGASGDGYNKFGNTESKYYISSYNKSANTNRVAYNEAGSKYYWWLRSPHLSRTDESRNVYSNGLISNSDAYCNYGLAFGFCIQ